MNNVTLLGRITKDPELKYTGSGKLYCRFTLAVNREFNKEETDFINCVAWDKRAETIEKYLKKGKRILVAGRLMIGSYDNKEGKKVYTTDVIVDNFNIIDFENKNENINTGNNFIDDTNNEDDEDFPF